MRQFFHSKEAEPLLRIMGYKPDNETCRQCSHFEPTDCSGSHNALNSHCKLNPAFQLEVSEAGRCDHWQPKAGAK
jgi:hypothetical protein